jgi:hypothetical protein
MAVAVADRIERPLSLFDELEALAPGRAPGPAPAPVAPEAEERGSEVDEEGAFGGGAVHAHGGVGGEPTLDDMLVAAWEGLTAQAVVACPICDGALQPLYGDAGGASPVVAGRCDRCGTTLS